ncbi:MAG: GNAT family N-acetyltransferase [Alphaproteobacteria bacterium]|jgi:hypothetical protein
MLKIKQFYEIDDNKWDSFVKSNSMGYSYFLKDLIKFHRYATYKNLSFCIINEKTDEILFIMQLHLDEHKKKHWWKKSHSNLVSQWGFMVVDNIPRKIKNELEAVFDDYIAFLIKKYNVRNFDILGFPPLADYFICDNKNFINPAMYLHFIPAHRYTYIVDLSKSEDKLLAECSETTRQAIRKNEAAEKYLIYESNGNEEDLNAYVKIHNETYNRTNGVPIAYEYHKNMFFNLIPKKLCRIFFLVDKNTNKKIAQVAILIYNKTAYYWWGGSLDEKDIGANKYLLFKVIKIIKQSFDNNGYFETGAAWIFLRTGKEKGLNDYKKSFGCFLQPIFTGHYLPK